MGVIASIHVRLYTAKDPLMFINSVTTGMNEVDK